MMTKQPESVWMEYGISPEAQSVTKNQLNKIKLKLKQYSVT